MGNVFSLPKVRFDSVMGISARRSQLEASRSSEYDNDSSEEVNPVIKVMEECLTNPIVVKTIMQHFSNSELLYELSFVNKMWNCEARNVMRKRGNLITSFDHSPCENSCDKFEHLLHDLLETNFLPFGKVCVDLDFRGQELTCLTAGWVSSFDTRLERFNWKHFSVTLWENWWDHKDCPGLLFLKRVFCHFSPVLETLILNIESGEKLFIPTIAQHPSFPSLKIIELGFRPHTTLVKALVSRAPNLQELHSDGDMNAMGQLLEGTSAVLVYKDPVEAPFEQISDNFIGALRLEDMRLEYTGPDFNFERFTRIAPILLQVCCTTTLRSVKVDAVLALPLMTYGVCLQNVNELEMIINYDQLELDEPGILRILKDFDFARIFPSLVDVTVKPSQLELELEPGHMNRIIEEASVLGEPLPDRAVNIKKLDLYVILSHVSSQFFAQMFSKVHKLRLQDCSEEIPFGFIWKHWQDLKKIDVRGKVTGNLDSVFCGIFPEEVAELEKMDEEYLGNVNIVPVMPAVTCLRNLNKLTLDLKLSPFQDPKLLFSKVTRLVAFKRIHGLSVVRLHTNTDGFGLDQFWKFQTDMKPSEGFQEATDVI